VISLDRTPQRFAQFLADNAGFAVQRFAACDGGLLTPAGCVAEGLISAENIYNAGALGTARSHVTLWRECVASGAPMVVAEDDIVLRADFWPAMAALLERVPGGTRHRRGGDPVHRTWQRAGRADVPRRHHAELFAAFALGRRHWLLFHLPGRRGAAAGAVFADWRGLCRIRHQTRPGLGE
jgi:hypothetical protein